MGTFVLFSALPSITSENVSVCVCVKKRGQVLFSFHELYSGAKDFGGKEKKGKGGGGEKGR